MSQNNEKYYSIGQVAKLLNLIDNKTGKINTHTLRFWEKNFKQIKPKLFAGRRRLYNDSDVLILKKIKFLLKDQGMTINGVRKILDNSNNNDTLNLDEISNNSIRSNNFKNKVLKISKIVKNLKNYK